MVDGRPTAPDHRAVLLAEAGPQIGQEGQPGTVQQRIVTELRGRTDPEAVAEDALQEVGRRDLTHLEQRAPRLVGHAFRLGRLPARGLVEVGAVALDVEGREHGEDDLTVLHGDDVARREGLAVAISVHFEDHGQVDTAGAEEVTVERVGQPVGLDGRCRRQEALRGHLAAEKALARPVVGVAAAEQVAVHAVEGQQRRQVAGHLEVHQETRSDACASRTARTQPAHVSRRLQNSSRVPAKLCMCPILGQTKRSTLGADS